MAEEKILNWNAEEEDKVDAEIIKELDEKDSKKTDKEAFEKELDKELGITPKKEEPPKEDTPHKEEPAPDKDKQVEEPVKDKEPVKDTPEKKADEKVEEKDDEEKKKTEREEQVKKYAEEYDIPAEEARKDLESFDKIESKFLEGRDKDSARKEMAKSLLFLQRRFTKSQEMLKEATTPKDGFYDDRLQLKGHVIVKPDVIKSYREAYPKRTDGADDDTVYEMAKQEYLVKVKTVEEARNKELPLVARQKRESVLANLSGETKRFSEDIKAMIESLPDEHIVSDSFRMSTVINTVKGRYYDKDVKTAKETGYNEGLKAGRERAEIEGEKVDSPGKAKKAPDSKKSTTELTQAEKDEAVLMYGDDGLDEKEIYQLYRDQITAENKKKK